MRTGVGLLQREFGPFLLACQYYIQQLHCIGPPELAGVQDAVVWIFNLSGRFRAIQPDQGRRSLWIRQQSLIIIVVNVVVVTITATVSIEIEAVRRVGISVTYKW